MRKFEIKEELLNEIAKYLATKPWAEVVDLMNSIHNPEKVKLIPEENIAEQENKE